jgi:hypothetical protein
MNMLRSAGVACIGLEAVLMAAACGGAGAAADGTVVERTDSAGVEVVINRGDDRPLDWTWQRVLTIGGDDDGPGAFGSLFNEGIAVAADGGIALLDAMSQRVLIFAGDGTFIREFGRKGGGPGEMEWPSSLAIDETGTISVYDVSKRGVLRFGADGTVLPQQILPVLHGGRLAVARGRAWGVFVERADVDAPTALRLLGIGTVDTLVLAQHVQPASGMVQFPNCAVRVSMPPVLTAALEWNSGGGGIAWSTGPEYSITVLDS